jgi:outer membrane protein assembly factor BamB
MVTKRSPILLAVVIILSEWTAIAADSPEASAEMALARHLLAKAGIDRGLCSLPRCGDGKLVLGILQSSEFLVHAQDAQPEHVTAARKLIDGANLLGLRAIIESGTAKALPYADNYVDFLVLSDLTDATLQNVSLQELVRVLVPRGQAIVGHAKGEQGELKEDALKTWLAEAGLPHARIAADPFGTWAEIVKPPLESTDEWRHWFHEPDNSAASRDTLVKAPYRFQWLGMPYFAGCPTFTLESHGRIFMITGPATYNFAGRPEEKDTVNQITARNAFNGIVLWQRALPGNHYLCRPGFIANGDTFYLLEDGKCLQLDAQTGKEKERIPLGGPSEEGKWIAIAGKTLYVLVGDIDPPKPNERSRGYNGMWRGERPPDGCGKRILAFDLVARKPLWSHEAEALIDGRLLGMLDGRIYYYAYGACFVCLDAATGKPLWTNADKDVIALAQEQQIYPKPNEVAGQYVGEIHWDIFSWGTPYNGMVCTPEAAVFNRPSFSKYVLALAATDGRLLWKREKTIQAGERMYLLYAHGRLHCPNLVNGANAVDVRTGENIKHAVGAGGCARTTANQNSFFYRHGSLEEFSVAQNTSTWWKNTCRPNCVDGAVPAEGLLFVSPMGCRCGLTLRGHLAFTPAPNNWLEKLSGTGEERREPGAGEILAVQPLDMRAEDWPTYRANNQRSAASAATVPEKVGRKWIYQPAAPVRITPAVHAGGLVFVGGDDGIVRCLDGDSGRERWRWVTAGPIRLPPTIWEGRACIGSGDGCVYCLEAATGRLLWRYRLASQDRRIMVYGRLSSNWPVHSGVLVQDGVAYAAAGIVEHDGVWVCALDARTGAIKWDNAEIRKKESQKLWVDVQGDLAVGWGKLFLAGRPGTLPASFDLGTGQRDASRQAAGGARGREVGVLGNRYVLRGGRDLYSYDGPDSCGNSFVFADLGEPRDKPAPGIRFSAGSRTPPVPPAWDDAAFLWTARGPDGLSCWGADALLGLLDKIQHGENALYKLESGSYVPAQHSEKNPFMPPGAQWGPLEAPLISLVLGKNAAVVTCEGKPATAKAPVTDWFVRAIDRKTGNALWEEKLDSEPLPDGLCLGRNGETIVTLRNGQVVCLAKKD